MRLSEHQQVSCALTVKAVTNRARDVLEVARVALLVNVAKEGRRLPRTASKGLEALVG